MTLRGLKLALVLALLMLTSALAQSAPSVTVARISGTVEVAHRDVAAGAWQAARQGQTIGAGWKLRTGAGGKVQLTLPRNNTVVLKENSVLYVDKLDAGGGGKVKSDKGGFLFQLKNALGSGSTFEVDTPAALATVRGTEFGVLLGAADADVDGEDFLTWQRRTGSSNQEPNLKNQSQFQQSTGDEASSQNHAIGDLDGDGRADFIVVDLDGDGALDLITLSRGSSALTGRPVGQPAAAGLGAHVQRQIEGGDLDGDGRADLIVFADGADEDEGVDATETLRKGQTWEKMKDSDIVAGITRDLRDGAIDGVDALIAGGWIEETQDGYQVNSAASESELETETIEFRSGMDTGIRKSAPAPPAGPVPIPYPNQSIFEDGSFEQWAAQQTDGVIDRFTWTQVGGPLRPLALHGYSGEVEVENEFGADTLVGGTSIFVVGNDPPEAVPSGPDAAELLGELTDFMVFSDPPQDFDTDAMLGQLDSIAAQIAEVQGLLPGEHVGELVEILIGLNSALEELAQIEADFQPIEQALTHDPDVQRVAARIAELRALVGAFDRQGQTAEVTVRGWDPKSKEPILGRIDRELTRIHEEWQRYDHNDQAVQMMFLWKQVLDLHDELHELIDDVARQSAAVDPEHPTGDEIEQMLAGPFQFTTQQGTLLAGQISPLVPELESGQLPAVRSVLLPAVQQLLELMEQMNAQILALHERMEEMGYEIEPLIVNNEDLRELLRGLIDSGDPVLGLRWQSTDTDNDGLPDVVEIALGLDPLVSNDDGFIELIEPDDRESFEFPQDNSVTFGFEPLDTDAIEEYTLVLEADGRRFTRRGVRGFDRVELDQLVGPGGAFADSVGPDGEIEVEWFVTGRIDRRAVGALDGNPSPGLGEIESERRSFTIQFPVQGDPIILDLNETGVAPQVGGPVRVRGSISEVNALGEWEIRIAYDPQVLQFERGQRLGIFSSATVFFGEQGGGIVVVSGSAPRGNGGGLSGEGDIFELEFTALEAENTFVEGDELSLRDSFGNELEAEFGTDASFDIEETRGINRNDPDADFFRGGSLLRQ